MTEPVFYKNGNIKHVGCVESFQPKDKYFVYWKRFEHLRKICSLELFVYFFIATFDNLCLRIATQSPFVLKINMSSQNVMDR